MTLALCQFHSEIHVVYFLLHKDGEYEFRCNPPRYICRYQPREVSKTIAELEMPINILDTCYSTVIAGGYFAKASGNLGRRYQEFTVELFGKRTNRVRTRRNSKWPFLQRRDSITAWHESTDEIIEIWRTRTFLCSLRRLRQWDVARRDHFPYLEETWHPSCGSRAVSLHALEILGTGYTVERFHSTAVAINKRNVPPNAPHKLYRTSTQFLREVKRVFGQLLQDTGFPPGQKAVALKMSLALSTFKAYWRETGLRWNVLTKEMIASRK